MKARSFVVLVLTLVVGALGSGCHHVASNYPEYLAKHAGESRLPKTALRASYTLSPRTEDHRYQFRSFAAGYGNRWIVELGPMLDATMRSGDLQAAFRTLDRLRPGAAAGSLITVDVVSYEISGFSAHITLKLTLRHAGATLIDKNYSSDGQEQVGKVVWGGAFAMRNATQQTTKLALDKILRAFLVDVNRAISTKRPQRRLASR